MVYFSARHTLSPDCRRAMLSLSHHVILSGQDEDPETAYANINACDVFILYLHFGVCQKLFLIYELGVAFVLRKPIIAIRETHLAFSEILIPKSFNDIEVLIPPGGSNQTVNVLGKTYKLPLTLAEILTNSYENSVCFCPDVLDKCITLLLDKIFNFSKEFANFRKKYKLKLQSSKSTLGQQTFSIHSKPGFNNEGNDKVECNAIVNTKYKLDKLRSDAIGRSINDTPKISISKLVTQGNKQSETNFKPVNPVIYQFQGSARFNANEELDASDSSSSFDVTHLNGKTFIASTSTSPLPSPILPRGIYYPSALPVHPMELSFPPFQIEKLHFDKHAVQIAKADKLPSIVRRRLMRKQF